MKNIGETISFFRKKKGMTQNELAEKMNVQNLLLYHTEDRNYTKRKELYTAEGKRYFFGQSVDTR